MSDSDCSRGNGQNEAGGCRGSLHIHSIYAKILPYKAMGWKRKGEKEAGTWEQSFWQWLLKKRLGNILLGNGLSNEHSFKE
jgi:hypothetical protein